MSLAIDPRWSEALAHLPDYLGNHVRVSVTALALGLLVSLPLAIAARNRPLPRALLLGLASIVQTVPGLALLALFYPLLLALASLSLAWFGFSFSATGDPRVGGRPADIMIATQGVDQFSIFLDGGDVAAVVSRSVVGSAIVRLDQWVASGGVVCKVSSINSRSRA